MTHYSITPIKSQAAIRQRTSTIASFLTTPKESCEVSTSQEIKRDKRIRINIC